MQRDVLVINGTMSGNRYENSREGYCDFAADVWAACDKTQLSWHFECLEYYLLYSVCYHERASMSLLGALPNQRIEDFRGAMG